LHAIIRKPRAGARLPSVPPAMRLASARLGGGGRVTGTYEKSVTGILAYALGPLPTGDEAVFILHVIHTARDWPEEGWPGK